ncbi:hypothetical protein U0070_013099, partial [Myodes glareolus]
CQNLIEKDHEHKVCNFYDQHKSIEGTADALGEEWKGYMFQMSGENSKCDILYKKIPRRVGERKHKSVHGCIVDVILNISNLVILKNNGKDIPGQTITL